MNFESNGKDKFGRDFPKRIVLKNGDIIYGHCAVKYLTPDGNSTCKIFKVIEDIDSWKDNRLEIASNKVIPLKNSDLAEISDYIF